MKLQKFVAAWMFMAAAIAFGEGSDFPLKVEGCFDPKGGHIQGMCRGGGFTYLTQMTGICKIDGAGAGTGIEFVGFENGKPRFLKSKTINGKGTISAEILAANQREVR